MAGSKIGRDEDRLREEAAGWLARLRSPNGSAHHAAFEEWYAADVGNADAYDAVLDSWEEASQAARMAGVPPTPHPAGWRPATWRAAAPIAAAVAIVAVASWSLLRPQLPADSVRTVLLSAPETIRSAVLEDGSRVTLDARSRVRAEFSPRARNLVLERGRVRFDVAHDARRLFIVHARGSTVVAHGTVFDVALRGGEVTVSLLKGSVEVRADGRPTQFLVPGQRLVVGDRAAARSPLPIRAQDLGWTSGLLTFEDAPLSEVIAAANRSSGRHIVVADSETQQLRFTGTFQRQDADSLAQMLAATFKLEAKPAANGDIILSRSAPAK